MKKPDDKVHILVIPSWYPSFKGDIKGSFFREQAIALSKAGNKVGVIYPQFRSLRDVKGLLSKPYGIEHSNDEGVNTYKRHNFSVPKLPKVQQYRWVKLGLDIFKIYIKEFGLPDIIHVHSLKPAGYLALEINKRYNIPFIVTEHSTSFARGLIDDNELKSLSRIVNSSNYNIAVSQPFSDLLENAFEFSHWNYIPNIVNNDFLNSEEICSSNEFIFLSVSLLTEKKAIDNLIKAFFIVNKVLPNTVLHIGGDGPDKIKLKKLVNNLNIGHKVKFLGSLTREKVKIEMAKSAVFVLPSRFETFGVVAVEALALGKPVIATKCGGPESIINENVGILIAVDDIDGLAESMIHIYSNYEDYDSNNIRQYCISNFSESVVTYELSKVYSSVLASLKNE